MRCTICSIDRKKYFPTVSFNTSQQSRILCSQAHRVDLMDESLFLIHVLFPTLQLIERWALLFKNYVKKAQDHLDCLSAFEEHFLEQEKHWPAMIKVRTHPVSLFFSYSFSVAFSFSRSSCSVLRPINVMKSI